MLQKYRNTDTTYLEQCVVEKDSPLFAVSSAGPRTCSQPAGCIHYLLYSHFDLGETTHRERGDPDLQTLLQ